MDNDEVQKIEWRPQEGKQTEALRWRIFELFYGGARGGGKSEVGRAWLTIDLEHPNFRGLVIRKNSTDLADWVDKAKQLYGPMGAKFVGNPVEIRFPWGARISCGHLSDDSAYEKYQGQEYHRINIEELTQIPTEELYLKLLSSCRSTIPELKPRVFCSGNPGGVGHAWVKKRFVDVAEPMTKYVDPITGRGRVFIPATVDDNPLLLASDPSYIRFLDGLPDKLRRAWRDGNWDVFEGQYFEEWDSSKHTIDPFDIPPTWRRYRAYDHGRSAPACCLWFAVDYDGRVWCYRELYVKGLNADEIAQRIVSMSGYEQYEYSVADPAIFAKTGMIDQSGGETIAAVFARHGVTFQPASNRRIDGWQVLHKYLYWTKDKDASLVFFRTCENAIRTIPLLQYDDRKAEDVNTTQEDHAADAVRYMLTALNSAKTEAPKTAVEIALERIRQRNSGVKTVSSLNRFYQGEFYRKHSQL